MEGLTRGLENNPRVLQESRGGGEREGERKRGRNKDRKSTKTKPHHQVNRHVNDGSITNRQPVNHCMHMTVQNARSPPDVPRPIQSPTVDPFNFPLLAWPSWILISSYTGIPGMYVWYGNDGFESAHRIPGWIDKGEDHQPQFRSPLFFWISCLNLIDLMARMLQSLRRVLGLNLPRSAPKYSRSINTNFSYFQRPFPLLRISGCSVNRVN